MKRRGARKRIQELTERVDELSQKVASLVVVAEQLVQLVADSRKQFIGEEIAARSIVVMNSQGVPVARLLAADDDSGRLLLADRHGLVGLVAAATERGGVVNLADAAGEPVVYLSGQDGKGSMLLSGDGKHCVVQP